MTQEEKQLLLRDLCERIPYGVRYKGDCGWPINPYQHTTSLCNILNAEEPLVYLRPMSSMTEEEKKEFQACHCIYELHPDFQPMMCNLANECNMFDWLNAHHFDYRGLIPMGLALESTEGMYDLKK